MECLEGQCLLFCEDAMDIRTLFYNLREEVSCAVCSDIFKDPRHLPCLHSFCLHCLKHWYHSSGGGNAIRCPKCQAFGRIPASGDLNDLPTNFYLNGLIDVLHIKECNSTQVTCSNCDKKSSESSYCFQCCMFYCEQCLIGHNMMRNHKDHRVLAVKEFQDKDYEDVLKRPAFCPRQGHQKELKFFCKTCENAVCQTCVTLEHGGHALKLIEEEAENQKIEMAAMIQRQRDNLQAKMEVVAQLDEDCAKLIQQEEKVKRDVETFAERLIEKIQAKKQNIAKVENETKTRTSIESLTKKKAKIQQEIKTIESSVEKADKCLTRSTNAEVVQLKQSLDSIFDGIVQTDPTVRDIEALPSLVFVENQKMLDIANGEEIGFLETQYPTKASKSMAEGNGLKEGTVGREAQFNLITKNVNGRQCYNKRDRVTVEMRDEQGRECVTQVRVDDKKTGSYHISYFPRVQGRYKFSIKVNGEHVRGSPFTVVVVKPFQFKPVLTFGKQGSANGMFQFPKGVAVSNKDEIAVADGGNHRVQIFNSNGDFTRSFGRKGNKQGEFNFPYGIAYDKDGNIFVADMDNHRIQIFSGEGRYMGTFGEKGSLDSQLSDPWGLSLDTNGNIIVADAGNKLIMIFSPQGNFIRKIGGPGSFSFPVHCVQCDGYFIVSDRNDNSIKVFDEDGVYKYKFGKKGGGDGEFNSPRFLSVTKSGHLLVSDWYNCRIQFFEMNGTFVGKFGTGGSKLGEFNKPFSVAVLSNNQIVVCDYGNYRLQIFQ